ncbi:transmembrane and TPR repeat-containing protein 2 [Sarcoptes scabiei]|nr:transmembrane and TPR repeat-containing protein 2 [Sarcoptes scabiei]
MFSQIMHCEIILIFLLAKYNCFLLIESKQSSTSSALASISSQSAKQISSRNIDKNGLPISHYSIVRKKPLDKSKLKYIEIGGLFPMNGTTGWLGGQGCLPAAMMALEDVNNNENLLAGYYLNITWNNSQCDPGLGAAVLYDLIYRPPNKTLILGGCSIVCSTIAETAKMYNLIVIGYGSSSPALSDRQRFPTFFRTHPSATIHNPTRVKLFKKFKWTRIAIIIEAEEVFVTTGKDLEIKCKEADIEIVTRVSFLEDPIEAVKSLARQDARIIIGMAYGGAARKMMCEAYKNGLYGKQHVWFLIGWYEDNWFHPVPGINCTMEEMMMVVEKHFTTEALMLNQGQEITIAGMTARDWLSEYQKQLPRYKNWFPHGDKPQEGFQEAPLAYDAIWAVAFALNRSIERLNEMGMSLDDFDYEKKEITDVIKSELQRVQFLGVSGDVAFNDIGDRISWTLIEQMINGTYQTLGFYDTATDNLTWYNREQWYITGRVPKDRTEIVPTLMTVNRTLFVTISAVSLIGILFAIFLLGFNFKFRDNRLIQMSNSSSNNIMLVGSIFCLISVQLFGIDGQDIGIDYFELVCNSRAFFLSVGFSLFFGAMFAKIWVCHVLHTQNKRKINNNQIYLIVGVFCSLDLIILAIWLFHDPMTRRMEYFPLEDPPLDLDDDVKFQPLLEHCEANLIWYGILYGYKGLVLFFGLFLSYETRSAKLKQINDSRLVAMSIYNVVILCLITAPVSLVIDNQVNSHFAFIGLTIIFCCFLSMALIFTPKIVIIVQHRQNLAAGINNVFHETMSTKEEEERFLRLNSENDELKLKIAEKEKQIEEVKKKIDQLAKEQMERKRNEERSEVKTITKKAVRIQEPSGTEQSERYTNGNGKRNDCVENVDAIETIQSNTRNDSNKIDNDRTGVDKDPHESYL